MGASTLGGTARIVEPSAEQAVAKVGSSRIKNALATDYRLACHGAIVGRIANRAKPKLKRISGGLSVPARRASGPRNGRAKRPKNSGRTHRTTAQNFADLAESDERISLPRQRLALSKVDVLVVARRATIRL